MATGETWHGEKKRCWVRRREVGVGSFKGLAHLFASVRVKGLLKSGGKRGGVLVNEERLEVGWQRKGVATNYLLVGGAAARLEGLRKGEGEGW